MVIRNLKIVFVTIVSLLCLLYAAQNVANLDACYQTFAYVLGAADHLAYPHSIIPAIQSSAMIWLTLILVVALEFAAGFVSAKGAWDLWSARKAPAAVFNGAKTFALVGCGIGMVVWGGLFAVFGGALFQMWQTDIGRGSLESAFQFFATCALVFIVVNGIDD